MSVIYSGLPPATSDNQDVSNVYLSQIQSALSNLSPDDSTIIARLNSILAAFSPLATAANQATGNATLASILSTHSTAAKQDIGNTSLANIDSKIGSTAGAITNLTQSPSSQVVLTSNVNRKGFILYNDASVKVFISFGATASSTSFTLQIPANSGYESAQTVVYKGTVSAAWNSGTSGFMRITELT